MLGTDFLGNKKVQELWGEDLCAYINFCLFEPLGYKLRHKIAHGNINASECSFVSCILVFFLYIFILSSIKEETIKT